MPCSKFTPGGCHCGVACSNCGTMGTRDLSLSWPVTASPLALAYQSNCLWQSAITPSGSAFWASRTTSGGLHYTYFRVTYNGNNAPSGGFNLVGNHPFQVQLFTDAAGSNQTGVTTLTGDSWNASTVSLSCSPFTINADWKGTDSVAGAFDYPMTLTQP